MTFPPATVSAFDLTPDPAWRLDAVGYDPFRETSRQSRFAISNGLMGVRGERAFTRGERWITPSRTSVAGLFDTSDATDALPRLVPAPDWLQVRLVLPDGPMVHETGDVPSHRMRLDMKRGALLTECRHEGAHAAVRVRELRLVSASQRAIGLQRIQFLIERGEVEARLEAPVAPVDAALTVDLEEPGLAVWRAHRSGTGMAMAACSSLAIDGVDLASQPMNALGVSWTWTASSGQVVEFSRLIALTVGQSASTSLAASARRELGTAVRLGWTGVLAQHEAAWSDRWGASDVRIDGDPAAQDALRFAAYHLNGAANPDNEFVSIAARGLTGEDYAGHVFWDTEIFLLPFYILTWPEAARALLMYRFHTLDGARAKAARLGWRGALYAWESADTGADVTPDHALGPDRQVLDILCGTQEQHISADVAYAVWQYWTLTGDEEFLCDAGAEILLETARFWVSRAVREEDGRRHIRGVIGPDEYHETVDDNAFTNMMARWNIERGVEAAVVMLDRWPDRWDALSGRLGLTQAELANWPGAARSIATGLDARTGLFEQFEGYATLEHIDLETYSGRSVPMDVVLGRDRTAASQVIKQADVVVMLALLPEAFPDGAGDANFAWYEPRCSHGSSLSTAMHGLAAARLGLTEKALDYFRRTSAIDLCDAKAAIAGGIHMAALGGVWMTAVLGFAGVSFQEDGIALHPQLPPGWSAMRFPLQWRGRRLKIAIDPGDASVSVLIETGEAMAAHVGEARYWLEPGQVRRIPTPRQDGRSRPVAS